MTDNNPIRFGIAIATFLTILPLGTMGLVGALVGKDVPMLPLMGAAQLLLMLLPTILLARYQHLPPRELFRLKNPGWAGFAFLIAGLLSLWPLLQCYLLFQELFLLPSSWMEKPREYQEVVRSLFGSTGVLAITGAIFIGAVIPGISEELLFRGLVMRSFEERLRPLLAVGLTALLFGIVHFNPILLVPLAVLGTFFGMLTIVCDSIYPAMAGHAIFNSVSIVSVILGQQDEVVEPHTVDYLIALLPLAAFSLVIFGWVASSMRNYWRQRRTL